MTVSAAPAHHDPLELFPSAELAHAREVAALNSELSAMTAAHRGAGASRSGAERSLDTGAFRPRITGPAGDPPDAAVGSRFSPRNTTSFTP
jgi:hypothetical protein